MIRTVLLFLTFFVSKEILCIGQNLRGIATHRLPLYNALKDFVCLDGSLKFPFSYVNDDYCDCPDGSDEPGTAACPNGIFYCANKGYIPKNIPSGFVNDGFCDCCDASDEYNNENCTNTCEVLGQEAKRLAEELTQMVNEGSRIRAQMVVSAKNVLESKQKRVAELENEKAEAIRLRDEAEAVKKDAEAQEAAALEQYKVKEDAERAQKAQEEEEDDNKEAQGFFNTFDDDGDLLLQIHEIKTHKIFDQNMDGEVSSDEVKYIEDVTSEPLTFEMFKGIVWPRIKPIIVMNKIKKEEGQALFDDAREDPETVPPLSVDLENDQDRAEEGKPVDEEDEEEGDEDEGEEPEPRNDFTEASEPKYDEQTTRLVEAANEARSQYDKAARVVQDVEREMTNLKTFLSKDYGEEDEFVPLDGQCFTYTDREYSYKLCPFDQVTQMGKSGGSETRLGTWAGWGDKNYSFMLYDKGQSCWNGPQRSTKVTVACGLENEVTSASEPNKCEYVLEFKTPAACKLVDRSKDSHDEL